MRRFYASVARASAGVTRGVARHCTWRAHGGAATYDAAEHLLPLWVVRRDCAARGGRAAARLCAIVLQRTIVDTCCASIGMHAAVALDRDLDELARSAGGTGTRLMVCHGEPVQQIVQLALRLGVQAVYASHDDDPCFATRCTCTRRVGGTGRGLHTGKDHVVFERDEVLSVARTPYSVFTPYKAAWLRQLDERVLTEWPVRELASALTPPPDEPRSACRTLQAIGFEPSNLHTCAWTLASAVCNACGNNSSIASTTTRAAATFRRSKGQLPGCASALRHVDAATGA